MQAINVIIQDLTLKLKPYFFLRGKNYFFDFSLNLC